MGCLGAKAAQFLVCYYTGLAAWAAGRSAALVPIRLPNARSRTRDSRIEPVLWENRTKINLAEAAWQA